MIRIKASPEKVWNAIMISPAIPMELKNALRDRKTGQKLNVSMSAGGRRATLTVNLLTIEPFREVRWKGYLWIPGLFDGKHSFEIRTDTEGVTLLVRREIFSGLLIPFLLGTLSATKHEFETMNAAIRDEAGRGTT
jgi:hypothetical protein